MILLACGEFKSKVYPIWYAQRFEGVDNFWHLKKIVKKVEWARQITPESVKEILIFSQMVSFLLIGDWVSSFGM